MIAFFDFLGSAFTNLVRSLHPRELRRFAAELPVLGPLAVRSVRRRWIRQLLVGLSLAAGMMVYITLAASTQGAAADFTGRVEPLRLPADVIVFYVPGSAEDDARLHESLRWRASIGDVEPLIRFVAATSAGSRTVIGLEAESRLWPEPVTGTRPEPGQILAPRHLVEGVGRAGSQAVPPPAGGLSLDIGAMTAHGYSGASFAVSGSFERDDNLFGEALLMPLESLQALLPSLGPTGQPVGGTPGVSQQSAGLAVWVRAGSSARDAIADLRELLPGASVLWSGTSSELGARLIGGFLSPNTVILGLVFALAGLSVFNVMLLSLLQRKTQLGALKALGLDDDEVFTLLVLEGGLTALAGAVLGLVGGAALVRLLDATAEMPLHLTPASLVWAGVLAVATFYLATWLPATLCRRAMPIQLMVGRRLYLNPRSTCAQCGRCGGF